MKINISDKMLMSIIGGLLMVLWGIVIYEQRELKADTKQILKVQMEHFGMISNLSGRIASKE